MKTAFGYIGADSFTRQRQDQGQRRKNGGGGAGGSNNGGGGGGGGGASRRGGGPGGWAGRQNRYSFCRLWPRTKPGICFGGNFFYGEWIYMNLP